jgi:hypothetical protein
MGKYSGFTDKKTGKLVDEKALKGHIDRAKHSTTEIGRQEKYNKTGDKIPEGYDLAVMGNMLPEQKQLFGEQFEHVGRDSYNARLARGDQSLFAEMEEPSMREFNELQGQTASRFSGMGQGGRRSSGFQNKMTQANRDFASQLASRRQELQRNAIKDLMGMSHTLLNEKYEDKALVERPQHSKKKRTDWMSATGSAVFGGLLGYAAGDPVGGAQAGWNTGNELRRDDEGNF